jgi:nitrite reductase/ring-hydroxylating ferredoxin subunit
MSEAIWWAVARSEEINAEKPFNVDVGDQPIVLWRDTDGTVRALEDRCPHRRAPLSLGCILGSGALQCGYHGWTFDGESGQLVDIPNLKSERKYPPVYKAKPFGVHESAGFVRICLDAKAPPPAGDGNALPLSGTSTVALEHGQYIAALFDDPSLLISIKGVRFSPYLLAELCEQEGQLVMERSCQWASPHWPAPFTSDFTISLRIATDPVTGESDLTLRDDEFNLLLQATLAPVPGARQVTQVRWRAMLSPERPGLAAKAMGLGAPLRVHDHIDGTALRVLKPSASIHADDLREEIAARTDQQDEVA